MTFKIFKEENRQPRILDASELSFRSKSKRAFSDKLKQNLLLADLQVLQAERK